MCLLNTITIQQLVFGIRILSSNDMKVIKEYLMPCYYNETPESHYATLYTKMVTSKNNQKGRLTTFSSLPDYQFILTKNENKDILLIECSTGCICETTFRSTYKEALEYILEYSLFGNYIRNPDKFIKTINNL